MAASTETRTDAAHLKLKVRELRKSYGAVVALNDASIDLKAGEFLTLLGPSGSGKTTLLMAIAGLTDPDGGSIYIDGRLATHARIFERDIGMVFQNYALFPHMTVFDNIAFPLRMRRVPSSQIRTRVMETLEIVKLDHLAGRYSNELSGGQQQRVALARCFVYQPSIILMDEPLGALDKNLRDDMQVEIKRLHGALGTTVLYVTHDQEEALALSDRICLMRNGGIVQIGSPSELYFAPCNEFVAKFIGHSNLFEVEVEKREPLLLRCPDGQRLRAVSLPGLVEGDRLKAMVRPEAISIDQEGGEGSNTIKGTIQDIIMLGSVTRYLVDIGLPEKITVTSLTRPSGRRAGDSVTLTWPIDQTIVISS